VREAGRSSWQLNADVPESLQLVAHVGIIEGFAERLGEPIDETSAAEREWRRWWERAIREEIHSEIPAEPSLEWYDPPEFLVLGMEGMLRARDWCLEHSSAFHEEWRTVGWPLFTRATEALDAVRPDLLVSKREEFEGRTARPFSLEVYFVRGLGSYHRDIFEDRVILGDAYLGARNRGLLRSALSARISALA
jgi:hypothetical protein